MGSRAVVVCRDGDVAERRFGIPDSDTAGIIVTRTGRRFLDDPADQRTLVDKVRRCLDATDLWAELETDWLVLDAELLPWSAKAEELLRRQYASVGAAATATLGAATAILEAARARGAEVDELAARTSSRLEMTNGFVSAYREYCWPVESVEDLRLAPFQILAGEGKVHALTDHEWHMRVLSRRAETDPTTFRVTKTALVDLADPESEASAVEWWEEMTGAGGEGMVVKPVDVVHQAKKGIAQPGIKCRGREYLRIIYGPEYTAEENLKRLRSRNLGHKRSLALREFALGVDALERFVAGEPLYRVHECVFGVLALESEPVDPRL